MVKGSADREDALLRSLGISDENSGRERAAEAREYIIAVGREVMRAGGLTFGQLVIAGVVARSQSLHEAAIASIEADNPHAAFTLLRAYAEQLAAVLYMKDHPDKAKGMWEKDASQRVPVGRITNYAQRSGRLANFRDVYDLLSQYAHPTSRSHFSSMRVGPENSFTWQSSPQFNRAEDKLVAYAWCVEFAYAIHEFLFEYAESLGLGKVIRKPGDT